MSGWQLPQWQSARGLGAEGERFSRGERKWGRGEGYRTAQRVGGIPPAALVMAVALSSLAWGVEAQGQSLTPVSGLQRSRVNASLFEPRRIQSEGAAEQRGRLGQDDAGDLGAAELPDAAPLDGQESTLGTDLAAGLAATLIPRSLKVGLGLTFQAEYNSNVTAEGGRGRGTRANNGVSLGGEASEDFILSAIANLSLQSQFANGISIGLSLGIGYEQYFSNPDFSGLILNTSAPGGIAVQFTTGDVHWTVFDHLSFSNDVADEPELSGVGEFSQFSNTAGVEAAWSPSEYLLLRLEYAHSNTFTSGEDTASDSDTQFSQEQQLRDSTSDSIQLTLVHPLNAMLQTGLTGSVVMTEQSGATFGASNSGGDFTTYGIGPFLSGQITHATDILLAGGVQSTSGGESSGTSNSNEDGDGESFYGSLQVNNRLTNFYSHSLSLGRDSQVGVISDTVSTDYLRYSGSLRLGRQMVLSGSIFTERSEQSGGQLSESFKRHGGGVSLSFPLRPTVGAVLGWQYTQKDSDLEERSYSQHRVFASVSWLF